WLRDGEVWFRRENHAERLQLGSDVNLRFVALHLNLAKVRRAPLGRDGPEHVGEVFGAELRWRRELVELRVDLDVTLLAFDVGFAERQRHQSGSSEINLGIAVPRPVVD